MSKEEKIRKTVRIRKSQAGIGDLVKQDHGVTFSDQLREAYDFWMTIVYCLAQGIIDEDEATQALVQRAEEVKRDYATGGEKGRLKEVLRKGYEEIEESDKN